jgi:hypothetical protein
MGGYMVFIRDRLALVVLLLALLSIAYPLFKQLLQKKSKSK